MHVDAVARSKSKAWPSICSGTKSRPKSTDAALKISSRGAASFCHIVLLKEHHTWGVGGDDFMRTFYYTAIGIFLVSLLAGSKALSVRAALAETAQVVAPDATQSPLTEDEVDLLNLLD